MPIEIYDLLSSALKYRTKRDWARCEPDMHDYAKSEGLFDIVFPRRVGSAENYYSFSECKVMAFICETRGQWKVFDSHCFECAQVNGWVELLMPSNRRAGRSQQYTTLQLKEISSKYPSILSWSRGDRLSYRFARINGWVKAVALCGISRGSHRGSTKKGSEQYFLQDLVGRSLKSKKAAGIQSGGCDFKYIDCLRLLKKYGSTVDWEAACPESFAHAKNRGWLEKVVADVSSQRKQSPQASKRECRRIGSHFKTRQQWKQIDPKTFKVAQDNGWVEECLGS